MALRALRVLVLVAVGSADLSLPQIDRLNLELLPYDPNPNPTSVVFSSDGRMRFTILTPELIRIEQGPDFDDRPSLAVVNRNLPSPAFRVDRHEEGLRMSTHKVELYYKEGSGVLRRSSLQAVNKVTGQTWRFGDSPSGNLLGTIRTLDTLGPTNLNCSTFIDANAHCEFGLISEDGWAILDDSQSPRLAGKNDWWDSAATSERDFYLFMHGRDYKKALSDYSKIGGGVPLPPRYMLGLLWTRWFDYDSEDLKDLVGGFSVRGIPLDTLIIDMNWHIKPWWGSYSFDKRIIPDPARLVEWIQSRDVAVALNVHDCLLAEPGCPSGTLTSDDTEIFHNYMATVGLQANGSSQSIPLDLLNESLALAKEDVVFGPLEKNVGVDMWWVDWQQGDGHGIGNLNGSKQNPTIWLNKLRYTNRKRWDDDRRGAVLSRFGGLGSHRYGQGFSGDIEMLDWDNLAYQPFFTATAANVLFSLWSHDVTGPNRDPELLVRWTQWGALSPMLRFHERGMSSGPCSYNAFPLPADECANVDLWANLPGRFAEAARKATLLRARLMPYMYTEVYKTYITGVPWFRPLYYDFPEERMAYLSESQYMFGDLITVAPIVTKSTNTVPTATQWSIWVPPGLWYSPNDGALIRGNCTYSRMWDLSETPLLIKAGALLAQRHVDPTHGAQRLVGLAMTNFTDLVFAVIPGASYGETEIYEDDGSTTQYVNTSAVGWIKASYETNTDGVTRLTVNATGLFSESITKRRIHMRLLDVGPIVEAAASTKAHPRSHYDGSSLQADIFVDWDMDVDGTSMWIEAKRGTHIDLSGIKGAIRHARLAKAALDEAVLTPGSHPCWHGAPCGFRPEDHNLLETATVGDRIAVSKSIGDTINTFLRQYKECVDREVTVENVLRPDTIWAPTQGGWPEAVRLRVNYAVSMIQSALGSVCESNPNVLMPLVCEPFEQTPESAGAHAHSPFREKLKRHDDFIVIISE